MLAELFNKRSYEKDWAGGFPVSENDLLPVRDVLAEFLSKSKKEPSKLFPKLRGDYNNFVFRSVPIDLGKNGKMDLYVFTRSSNLEESPIGLSIQKKDGFQVDNLPLGAIYFPTIKYFRDHYREMTFQFEVQRNLALVSQDILPLLKANK